MPQKLKYEISPQRSGSWPHLLSPSSLGTLSAAMVTFYPRTFVKAEVLAAYVPILSIVPSRFYLAILGFTVGYSLTTCANSLRWYALKWLFGYQDWMKGGQTTKSKIWALLVKTLTQKKPHFTYTFQNRLPKQPLPSLNHTLDKWIEVTRQFVTPDEHEDTINAAELFRKGDGPKVQEYLQEKSLKEVNWQADYWLYAAYLSCREPLPIHSNYYASSVHNQEVDQITRASTLIYFMAEYEQILSEERIPPVMAQDLVPLCMNSYQNMFGVVRIPGEHMDSIGRSSKKHLVVMRKGHFFKMDLYRKDETGLKLLNPHDIHHQLTEIVKQTDEMGEETLKVADLTAQNRTVWAKQRNILKRLNVETLDTVENALFIVCLDTTAPKDSSDLCKALLAGTGGNAWFDKCFNGIVFANGWGGANVEHSVIDAMVYGTMKEYWLINEGYEEGKLISDKRALSHIPSPEYLKWNLEGMKGPIITASEFHQKKIDDTDLFLGYPKYGKGEMKKMRISPDGFVQMALQLSYYRLHKCVPKTYEPATGRMYALGRTETVHPSSEWSVKWLQAMEADGTDKKTTIEFLKKAIKAQTNARLEATVGEGCDRHLLALLCASRELGMDLPALFVDKAWRKGFQLSTSQTPNRLWELGTPVDLNHCMGGFGPGTKDGYGVSYVFMGDDRLNVSITSWKSCEETSSKRLFDTLNDVLEDMKNLVDSK